MKVLLRLHRSHVLAFLLTAIVGGPSATATEPRLELDLEPPVISPGERAVLRIRLLDENGRPAVADDTTPVEIAGGEGLLPGRVEIARGAGRTEIAVVPTQAGAWNVTLTAEGFRSAERWIISPQPLPKRPASTESSDDGVYAFRMEIPPPPLEIHVPPSVSGDDLDRIFESLGDLRFDEHAEAWRLDDDEQAIRERLLDVAQNPRIRAGDRNIRLVGEGLGERSRWYSIQGCRESSIA